jgi:hypothetical protein
MMQHSNANTLTLAFGMDFPDLYRQTGLLRLDAAFLRIWTGATARFTRD